MTRAASASLCPQLPHFSLSQFLSFLFPHPFEQGLLSKYLLSLPSCTRSHKDVKMLLQIGLFYLVMAGLSKQENKVKIKSTVVAMAGLALAVARL